MREERSGGRGEVSRGAMLTGVQEGIVAVKDELNPYKKEAGNLTKTNYNAFSKSTE